MCLKKCGYRILSLLRITVALPLGDQDRKDYLAWVGKLHDKKRDQFIIDHLTRHLDVLDSKANAVILFTSILALVYVEMAKYAETVPLPLTHWIDHPVGWGWALLVGGGFSFIAVILLLVVQRIHWPNPKTTETFQYTDYLLKLRNHRTIYYRLAWRLTLLSVIILAATVAAYVFRYSATANFFE
jgi:hypothetical protein